MPALRRPLVAGNWKMNGLVADLAEIAAVASGLSPALAKAIDVLICPPATLIAAAARALGAAPVALGGQDCHGLSAGPHTGDVSAPMLRDAGATFVIVGHSERRADHGETDDLVRRKALAAAEAGLAPIVCVGETLAQRAAGETLDIIGAQLAGSIPQGAAGLVVAYEPIWAIGSGLTPTPADVAQAHGSIRERLTRLLGDVGAQTRVLYGGSVKPSNAATLLRIADVDGALVGGASLKADEFLAIAAVYG